MLVSGGTAGHTLAISSSTSRKRAFHGLMNVLLMDPSRKGQVFQRTVSQNSRGASSEWKAEDRNFVYSDS